MGQESARLDRNQQVWNTYKPCKGVKLGGEGGEANRTRDLLPRYRLSYGVEHHGREALPLPLPRQYRGYAGNTGYIKKCVSSSESLSDQCTSEREGTSFREEQTNKEKVILQSCREEGDRPYRHPPPPSLGSASACILRNTYIGTTGSFPPLPFTPSGYLLGHGMSNKPLLQHAEV
uniref:Uncharacterized protein n=1 Tax=Timema bartmani TaxID=61472 RepID=A0A7R9ESZ7_9NEOP|nr:unnamed protein product [Timema bartmani]